MDIEILFIDSAKLKRMQLLHVRFLLFDLRGREAFDKGHIENAFHLEKAVFLDHLLKSVSLKETPIVIYDEDGSDVVPLAQEAEKQGYLNIVALEGGYKNFEAAK